jgi:hypothetical protein
MATADRCRHCGRPLDVLARRRGLAHCGAAHCRQRDDAARTRRIQQATVEAARPAIAAQLPGRCDAPDAVVWLTHHESHLVEHDGHSRAAHRARLEHVIAAQLRLEPNQRHDAAWPAPDAAAPPQAARLCAACRGRCCQHGAAYGAFQDLDVLERWQAAHPGASLQDAVDHYVSRLPPRHVANACPYQAEQGCVLDRAERAPICNHYACEPLQAVHRAAGQQPDAAILALALHHDALQLAVLIDAGATHPVALRAAPDPGA